MADYFTNFSLILKLPNAEALTHALELHHQATQASQGEELPTALPHELKSVHEDWHFEAKADTADNQPAL